MSLLFFLFLLLVAYLSGCLVVRRFFEFGGGVCAYIRVLHCFYFILFYFMAWMMDTDDFIE